MVWIDVAWAVGLFLVLAVALRWFLGRIGR
jgi:hypothetical protein